MFEFKVSADSHADLLSKLTAFLSDAGAGKEQELSAVKSIKKKASKKAAKKKAISEGKEETATAEYTSQDISAKLQEVVNTKNVSAAQKILGEFGATRLSSIEPKDYADFIAECDKVLAE